jgi:hypothetical protein
MKLSRDLQRLALLVAISTITMGAAAAGSAEASPVTSITSTLTPATASLPQVAPFREGLTGTYTAPWQCGTQSCTDTGTIAGWFVLPAQPPNATQIESFRTLTSNESNGTLKLHCSEITRPSSSVTTGSCAVLSASGIYRGLAGHLSLTNIQIGGTTLIDTLVL